MLIQIDDPSDLPRPPEEVQVRAIDIDPYPDGRRLRVSLDLTPFVEPPNLIVRILGEGDAELAEVSVIGVHQNKLSLTLHLQGSSDHRPTILEAQIHYEDVGEVSQFRRKLEGIQGR